MVIFFFHSIFFLLSSMGVIISYIVLSSVSNVPFFKITLFHQALSVLNNGLTSLPSAFFIKCSQLITLDLHGTEITNDVLRQV